MCEVIAIANQKGGVGKTTTAINFSAALAFLGKETLLVDMDPQANATSGLGFDKRLYKPNMYNVLVDLTPIEKTIRQTASAKLSVAGASPDMTGAEVELVSAVARESRLKGSFSSIKNRFEFIVIDCPPSLGLLSINALSATDCVIIPVQGEYYAMEGLAQFINAVDRVKSSLNPNLRVGGGVLTMFDPRISLAQQVQQELKKYFGSSLFSTFIPRSIRLAEAPGFGQTIFQYDARSKGAEAYLALANEFLAQRNTTKAGASEVEGGKAVLESL